MPRAHHLDRILPGDGFIRANVSAENAAANRVTVTAARDAAQHTIAREDDFATEQVELR